MQEFILDYAGEKVYNGDKVYAFDYGEYGYPKITGIVKYDAKKQEWNLKLSNGKIAPTSRAPFYKLEQIGIIQRIIGKK